MNKLQYLSGFGNEFSSCHPGWPNALPKGQNSPQKCAYGLYAEQISGTAFTAPREVNKRAWLYRIRPSVLHEPFVAYNTCENNFHSSIEPTNPSQIRWKPFPLPDPKEQIDFVDGIRTIATAGHPTTRHGTAIHVYLANKSMDRRVFFNSDGDFLIVPQCGSLLVTTEFGKLQVEPEEIVVLQQGMKFKVDLVDQGPARGYILEVFDNHFVLPNLGPIGANGLANPRDFLTPVAAIDRTIADFEVICKFQSNLFKARQGHSPFDVVAWHGNYTPYKYALKNFSVVGSISFDHPDPSIYTVLTCPSNKIGTAIADFVIFPPRWAVAENTFRPPYFHRNCMSEFMGLITGSYEAKSEGFKPGGASLHSIMLPHGPDTECYQNASQGTLKPVKVAVGTMAFMFETSLGLSMTDWAKKQPIDEDYFKCWQGLKGEF